MKVAGTWRYVYRAIDEHGEVIGDVCLPAEDASSGDGDVLPALRVHDEDAARPHEHVVDLRAAAAPGAGPPAVMQEREAARRQRRERAGHMSLGAVGDHPPFGGGARLGGPRVESVGERDETATLVARRPACLAHAHPPGAGAHRK